MFKKAVRKCWEFTGNANWKGLADYADSGNGFSGDISIGFLDCSGHFFKRRIYII